MATITSGSSVVVGGSEGGGSVKSTIGKLRCADSITSCQINAGKVPPDTFLSVRGGTIEIWASG